MVGLASSAIHSELVDLVADVERRPRPGPAGRPRRRWCGRTARPWLRRRRPGPGRRPGSPCSCLVSLVGGVRRLAGGDHLQRPDVDLVVGLEGDRPGRRLGALEHLDAGRQLGAGGQQGARRLRRPRPDAEQPQELDLGGLGDLVEPVEQRLAEVGEQLEQRDARVGLVVVGPLRRVDRDPADQLVPQLLVGAVVEDGRISAIGDLLQVEGVDEVVRPPVRRAHVGDVDPHQRRVLAGRHGNVDEPDPRLPQPQRRR